MSFTSINPYNETEIAEYPEHTDSEIESILGRSKIVQNSWQQTSFAERSEKMRAAASLLRENADKYAKTVTLEMGKPITEAIGEVEKCAWVCEYYADHAGTFLSDKVIQTDAAESFVRYEPLGTIFAIMPWNFPFWQVFRFAAPTLMAGNAALLKHASNVFGCATHIEQIFKEAGFPEYLFQNLFISHKKTEKIIAHHSIKAVTLTGSERAGTSVAQLAGKYLKKSVLELGGSNAFIILDDADPDSSIETAVNARMMNSGQSCIAAKRFILVESMYDRFLNRFTDKVAALKSGDPLERETQIGPLARPDLAENLEKQIQKSVNMGARLHHGGRRNRAWHEPTILTGVQPGMPVFDEETFGPAAAVIKAKNSEEALQLATQTRYGLGVTLCTQNTGKAKEYISRFADGAVFVNELVKSDPRLPFGGTNLSGYGRELSEDGIKEFVNKKTVYIK